MGVLATALKSRHQRGARTSKTSKTFVEIQREDGTIERFEVDPLDPEAAAEVLTKLASKAASSEARTKDAERAGPTEEGPPPASAGV